MTEMITNAYEAYPAAVSRPPASVSSARVLAWAETARRNGEYPGGVVLCASTHLDRTEYVTWLAYTRDGGETWHATDGHYISDHAHAWDDFTRRAGRRLATS